MSPTLTDDMDDAPLLVYRGISQHSPEERHIFHDQRGMREKQSGEGKKKKIEKTNPGILRSVAMLEVQRYHIQS